MNTIEKEIKKLYFVNRLSLAKISKILNINSYKICKIMDRLGLQRRSISEALTGRKLSEEHARKVKINLFEANLDRHLNGLSEETKRKISLSLSGRKRGPCNDETKKKMREAHLGKKMSESSRKKMSDTRKANPEKYSGENHPLFGIKREDITGENHPLWNGGSTSLNKKIRRMPRYLGWRNKCFERDKYTCQFCGKINTELNVDHIIQLAKILYENNIKTLHAAAKCKDLWDTKNGRTLCVECHKNTETWGKVNYKKQKNNIKEEK